NGLVQELVSCGVSGCVERQWRQGRGWRSGGKRQADGAVGGDEEQEKARKHRQRENSVIGHGQALPDLTKVRTNRRPSISSGDRLQKAKIGHWEDDKVQR